MVLRTIVTIMQHNFSTAPAEIPSDFTSTQITLLNEIRDKAIATVRKEGVKMSDISTALNILIKVEKQYFILTHRRIPGQKTRQPRSEPAQLIPFAPTPDKPQAAPAPPNSPAAAKQAPKIADKTSAPSPKSVSAEQQSRCMLKNQGYISESCTACTNGVCCIAKD